MKSGGGRVLYRVTSLAVTLGAFFSFVLVPGQPATASKRRMDLGGVTWITADRSSSMKVRLPADVDPNGNYEGPIDPQPGYQMGGRGRVVGFVLTKEEPGTPLGEGPTLYGWRLGRCMRPGCRMRGFGITWVFYKHSQRRHGKDILPAGNYRLYVIADGARARFRLELSGLTGEVRVRPNRPIENFRLYSLRPQLAYSGDDRVYWAGRSSPMKGRGFSLSALWIDDRNVEGAGGSCTYMDTTPPPSEAAYVPPCPLADETNPNFVNADYNEIGFFHLGELAKGMGLWHTINDPARNAGAIALWMKL